MPLDVHAQRAQGATLSSCRQYRYLLWRSWPSLFPDSGKGYAMFIGLNPSTADETADDPTIRRCITFAKDWGYEGLCMANLFAIRATDPQVMLAHPLPIGPDNDEYLFSAARSAGIVVAAWGTLGDHLGRAAGIKALLPELHHLRLTKDGHPGHPLYIPSRTTPQKWNQSK